MVELAEPRDYSN